MVGISCILWEQEKRPLFSFVIDTPNYLEQQSKLKHFAQEQ